MSRLHLRFTVISNYVVLAAVAVLCVIGAASIWSYDDALAKKQINFMMIGVGLMLGIGFSGYQTLGKYCWLFYLFSLGLLLYTVVPGPWRNRPGFLGVPYVNGAYAWIEFKFMRFQPAEVTKIAFILVLARYLRHRRNYRSVLGLVAPFVLAVVPLVLILKQPDLGTALVFLPCLLAMLFVAGAKRMHLLTIVMAGLLLAPVMWFAGQKDVPVLENFPSLIKGYQRERVHAMFSTDAATLQKVGYQQNNALTAIGSGGIRGKGWGNIDVSMAVPERHNDMVLALIGEQFGLVGICITLAAYFVLFAAGVDVAGSTKEPFGRLVALGLVAILAAQTFLNLMVALRIFPVTGVTLPFISYGGSSLLASFIAVGLLLSIAQHRPFSIADDPFEFVE